MNARSLDLCPRLWRDERFVSSGVLLALPLDDADVEDVALLTLVWAG
jgi:hypothetical protein